MAEFAGTDILKPRWDSSLAERAQRRLAGAGVLGLFVGLIGALAAWTVFDRHPLAYVLLSIGPALLGGALIAASVVIAFARPIGRLIARFPGTILCASVVGAVLLVWAHALLFDYVDRLIAANHEQEIAWGRVIPTAFGGMLTTREIYELLPGGARFAPISWALWPLQFPLVRDVVGLGGVVGFVSVLAMFAIWWERKVAARIQSRLGPMRVGGWHGWAQSLADGIKLLNKEDLIPAGADGPLFRLAPYLAFVPALMAFIALPFGTYWAFRNLDVALIFILAMLGIEVVGVIVSGWASNNKWSVFGAMREACQMVSYEIPMGMALLVPVMSAGTLSLVTIGNLQRAGWSSWLAFGNPFLFLACLTYFVASLASCKRAPFDLPEAESELVSGFHVEYSGFRFSLFFFAEYAAMFVVSALATTLFLGAWHSPLPASWGAGLAYGGLAERALHGVLFSGPIWFIVKSMFLVYVQMWLRWTLPRVRIDQVLYSCVQVMLPLAMVVLLGNTFWELLVSPDGLLSLVTRVVLSLIGAVLTMGFVMILLYGWRHRRRLVGTLAVDHLPGA